MTPLVRIALVAGIAIVATPAAASVASSIPEVAKAAKTSSLQFAPGATPEGWRVELPPRYKKAAAPKSKIGEVTKFREELPRYKKSSKSGTTGSAQ